MAVEMGARKRIKGGGSLRGAPSDVPERFREASGTAFSGESKKMAAKKEGMRGLIVDNMEICGFLTAFRRQTGVVRKKTRKVAEICAGAP